MTIPTTFPLFSSLPTEIRILIWHYALTPGRRIDRKFLIRTPLHGLPLLACKEAKAVADRCLTRLYCHQTLYSPQSFLIDYNSSDAVDLGVAKYFRPQPTRRIFGRNGIVDPCLIMNVIATVPAVEEILVVATSSPAFEVSVEARQEFVNFVCGQLRTRRDEEVGFLVRVAAQRGHGEKKAPEYRMPKVFVDMEAVFQGPEGGKTQFDIDLNTGEVGVVNAEKWLIQLEIAATLV